jgi:hypothetical protein
VARGTKSAERLRQAGSGPLKFCYEGRPLWLQCSPHPHQAGRLHGHRPFDDAASRGDRQKNDKRDGASLAVLHRGGLLTAVWVPDVAHEAMRDLIRARQAAVRAVRVVRQQLGALLLRHERIYPEGRRAWTKAHRGWLADESFAHSAQQIVLEESIGVVRLGELDLVPALQRLGRTIYDPIRTGKSSYDFDVVSEVSANLDMLHLHFVIGAKHNDLHPLIARYECRRRGSVSPRASKYNPFCAGGSSITRPSGC